MGLMELQAIPASHDDYAEYLVFFKELNLAWPALPCDRWCENLAFTFFICKGSKRVGYAMYEVYSATGFIRHLAVHPGKITKIGSICSHYRWPPGSSLAFSLNPVQEEGLDSNSSGVHVIPWVAVPFTM